MTLFLVFYLLPAPIVGMFVFEGARTSEPLTPLWFDTLLGVLFGLVWPITLVAALAFNRAQDEGE